MSENAFTLAVWTREVFNKLPGGVRFDDERILDEFVRPHEAEVLALFESMSPAELEALSGQCLEALAESETDLFATAADEARALVSTAARQHSATVYIVGAVVVSAVVAATTVAIIIAARLQTLRKKPGGEVEITFFPGIPHGTTDIIKSLLRKSKNLSNLVDKLKASDDQE